MERALPRRDLLRYSATFPFTLAALFFADEDRKNHVEIDELELVFEENFNDSQADTASWNVRDSGNFMATRKTGPDQENWPSINKDSRAVDQASNVEISGGTAKLWLKKADTARLSPYSKGWSVGKTFDHTAGYLDTLDKVEVKFGRWEFRAKLPVGPKRAIWCGIWLVSNKSSDKYFEIDLAEGFGINERTDKYKDTQTQNRAQSSVHFSETGKDKLVKLSPQGTDRFEDEWHTWAVEVLPDAGITFFLDGDAYFNVPAHHPKVAERFAQDYKFNIRLNVMTGSFWNTTDSDEKRAKPLEIDYVKVWRHNS